MSIKICKEMRLIKTDLLPDASRMDTIPHTMEESFIMEAASRANRGRSNVSMVEHG